MKITTISSSSSGNCYLLEREGMIIVLEAGARFDEVRRASNYRTEKITACLISHEHQDHCQYTDEYLNRGIDVYCSPGTKGYLGDKRLKTLPLVPEGIFAGAFNFSGFGLQHDAADPVGFVLTYDDNKQLVYAADTGVIEQRPKNLAILMVECNYTREKIKKNMHDEDLGMTVAQKKRIHENHLGLDDVLLYLDRIDTSKLEEIYLMHLSSRNSEPDKMVHRVQNLTGCPTYIAGKKGAK